uniref:Uncharacterized protein n=1 Tax=Arundo donax TaxID=35708 RepID=A0A0A8XRN1_ARUDO
MPCGICWLDTLPAHLYQGVPLYCCGCNIPGLPSSAKLAL